MNLLGRDVPLPPAWKVGAYAAAAVIVLLVVGELVRWYAPGDPLAIPVASGRRAPAVALPATKAAAKVERSAATVTVRPLAPTAKQEERLSGALRLDLAGQGDALLGAWETPASAAGGDVAVLTGADGEPRAVYVPKPRPFFEVGGPWEIGGGLVAGTEGYGGTVHVGKDLARAGRVTLKIEADADVLADGVQGRVAVLAVGRF